MGIPRVKSITGTLITRILRKKGKLCMNSRHRLFKIMMKKIPYTSSAAEKSMRRTDLIILNNVSLIPNDVSLIFVFLSSRIRPLLGLASEIPEDLYFLMKKAVTMRKHFDKARADKDCKFRLTLCESKIHRLARYYRKTRKLPPTWKYTPAKASAAVA
eukprot:Gregarina_sp_Poly_1__6022@NODE_3176_length_1301_cov_168_794976_g345_i1_p1_GENE_NODE_3176_length_1301_cov_168_794976_g345_i1NODE_3176_length_1301_cov_168_794976_g345_i1_p1_ORF_typecomplete_len158_score11_85Ribosomal_S15/PF00312_22/1_9e03Ribosomal_S15/PF00312_22/4_9e18Epimerase_2/PF02350_19/0_048Myb_DNAbind_4/PF13837_6/0_17_NODE_3176_length_1301_cov_168_794976_g345_i18261299